MSILDKLGPLVSIIIPFYNSEKYIRQCLDSIIKQTYTNLEIVCVNDGSEDSSQKIIGEYKDKRVRTILQENQGPGVARNTGMDACTGDYILFMDSDDYLHPDMIKKMLGKMTVQQCSIAMCKSFEFTDDEKKAHPLKNSLVTDYVTSDTFTLMDLGDKVFQFTVGWNWDKLYSSELLKKNGIRYPHLKNSEDLMVAYPAMFLSERMCYVNEYLVYHRVDNKESVSSTRRNDSTAFIESCICMKRFLDKNGLFSDKIKRSYVNWALNYALWNMDTLDYLSKIRVFKSLKRKGLKFCGISAEYGESYFFITWHYQRLLCIERMPAFVFALRIALDYYYENGFVSTVKVFLRR